MIKIAASIFTFNPNIKRLKQNLISVGKQVEEIFIVDNNSDNLLLIEELLKSNKKISLIKNEYNKGVAFALNQILKRSKENGYSWVITLDQDSICCNNLIKKYRKYLELSNLAMITCIWKNEGEKKVCVNNTKDEYELIDKCITSGCLSNTRACLAVGGFDDRMFIDYVDIDMCLTLKEHGYKILKINEIGLLHKIGNNPKTLWFGKKRLIIDNHNSIRKYYFARNRVYYIRKHIKTANIAQEIFIIICRIIFIVFLEKYKKQKMKACFKGIIDGIKMPINLS